MAGRMRVPRTRGVFSGLLLVLLGAWAALVAFVGPYFHYAYTPDSTWTYTSDRLWMQILPGAGAALGGLIVLFSAHRAIASLGAWLAAICGAWLVVGPVLSTLPGVPNVGTPTGGTTRQALEALGFFFGVGVAIVFFAAVALGRFTVIGVRETRAREQEELEAERLATMDNSALAATGLTSGFADTPARSTVDAGPTTGSHWYPGSSPGRAESSPRPPDPAVSGSPDATVPVNRSRPGGPHADPAAPTNRTEPGMGPDPAVPVDRTEPGVGRHAEPPPAAGDPNADRTTELPSAPPLSEQGEQQGSRFMDRLRPHHVGASSNRSHND